MASESPGYGRATPDLRRGNFGAEAGELQTREVGTAFLRRCWSRVQAQPLRCAGNLTPDQRGDYCVADATLVQSCGGAGADPTQPRSGTAEGPLDNSGGEAADLRRSRRRADSGNSIAAARALQSAGGMTQDLRDRKNVHCDRLSDTSGAKTRLQRKAGDRVPCLCVAKRISKTSKLERRRLKSDCLPSGTSEF